MLTARFFNLAGEQGADVQLPEELFDGRVHEAVLHQTIKAYLANQRQGTHATKTRGMVAGGGKKAWRQKGTGRARQGSIRAPHWRGGGIVFGPSPRSYRQDVPRKVKALARRSAFNTRAMNGQVTVLEGFSFQAPKTKPALELLGKLGVVGQKVLILTQGANDVLFRSVRNLPGVRVMPLAGASAYDVLNANQLVIESAALESLRTAPEAEVANA